MLDANLINANGYIVRNATLTVKQFEEKFKFTPCKYPKYFTIKNGLVCITSLYRDSINLYYRTVANNWHSLGLSNGKDFYLWNKETPL